MIAASRARSPVYSLAAVGHPALEQRVRRRAAAENRRLTPSHGRRAEHERESQIHDAEPDECNPMAVVSAIVPATAEPLTLSGSNPAPGSARSNPDATRSLLGPTLHMTGYAGVLVQVVRPAAALARPTVTPVNTKKLPCHLWLVQRDRDIIPRDAQKDVQGGPYETDAPSRCAACRMPA